MPFQEEGRREGGRDGAMIGQGAKDKVLPPDKEGDKVLPPDKERGQGTAARRGERRAAVIWRTRVTNNVDNIA